MELVNYYEVNINKESYYYNKFNKLLTENTFLTEYEYFDDKEIIDKLKELSYPKNNYNIEEKIQYILISFYLYNEGYIVKELPDILSRPTDINDFSISIRKLIIQESKDKPDVVSWSDRRMKADNLTIKKSHNISNITLDIDLELAFKSISNRNASFEQMNIDEKLQEICNAIEHLANQNGKWLTLDYLKQSSNLIDEASITTYRKKIQCFRHATKSSIKERSLFTDTQKTFLVNYGITICNLIVSLLKK